MTDTEGRTSKLAAAIARSGRAVAPEPAAMSQRRAVPMNGTILAGGAQPRQAEARARNAIGQSGDASPTASTGSADNQYDRAAPAPARRVRSSGRGRALWFAGLVLASLVGGGVALSLWLRGGPEFAEQGALGLGSPAPSASVPADPSAAPEPASAQAAASNSERASADQPISDMPAPARPAAGSADPVDAMLQQTVVADPPTGDAATEAPSARAAQTEVPSGPARPVAAVVPAGPSVARRVPVAAPLSRSVAGLPAAPRVQPSIVTGTEPPVPAAAPLPPASADPGAEAPSATGVFETPHNIIVHYNPSTPGAVEEAQGLAAALTAAGAEDVTVATVPFTISSTHLRQYHSTDAPLARAVSDQTGGGIEIRDFTSYSPRPAPGLIEVWIASG